jgi:hypothetical protein
VGVRLKYPFSNLVIGESVEMEKMENPNPKGVERAGEGAFSPTPNETAQQIQIVSIDLSDLPLVQKKNSAKILEDILRNYNAVTLAMVEFTSGGAVIIKEESAYAALVREIFREEEDDIAAVEKTAKELSKRFNSDIVVVALYTGDETAVAFTIPTKEKYVINLTRERENEQ